MKKKITFSLVTLMVSATLVGCGGGESGGGVNIKSPLETPSNFRIENQVLKWNKSSLAASYDVTISGQVELEKNTRNASLDLSEIVEESGAYTFSVIAKPGTGVFKTDSEAGSRTFNIEVEDVPTGLIYDSSNEAVTWDTTSGGHYEIMINNNKYTTNENLRAFTRGSLMKNTARVRTLGDGTSSFNSAFSEEYVFTFLDVAKNLRQEGQTIYWDNVSDNNGYILYHGTQEFAVISPDQTSYLLTTAEQDLTIAIMTRGNLVTTFNSYISEPISIRPAI